MQFLSILVALFVHNIFAATPGLYGIFDYTPEVGSSLQLVSINTQTGQTQNIGYYYSNYQVTQLSCIDDKQEIYYVIGYDSTDILLIGLDLNDGTIVAGTTLPFSYSLGGYGQTIDIDPNTGDLFLSGQMGSEQQIYRYEFATKQLNPIASITSGFVYSGASAYDSMHQVLWLTLKPDSVYLFALNVSTGELLWKIPDVIFYLATMNYDPVTGLIYALAVNSTTPTMSLIALNSTTAAMTEIGMISYDWNFGLSYATTALDWNDKVLFSYSGIEKITLLSFDIMDAQIINSPYGCILGNYQYQCPSSIAFHNQ